MRYKITLSNILNIVWPAIGAVILSLIMAAIKDWILLLFFIPVYIVHLFLNINYLTKGSRTSFSVKGKSILINLKNEQINIPLDNDVKFFIHDRYSVKYGGSGFLLRGYYYYLEIKNGEESYKFNSFHTGTKEFNSSSLGLSWEKNIIYYHFIIKI